MVAPPPAFTSETELDAVPPVAELIVIVHLTTKVIETVLSLSITTEHVVVLPEQASLQLLTAYPELGVAVRVTVVPAA